MPERLPPYDPRDDDPQPRSYEPYVDKKQTWIDHENKRTKELEQKGIIVPTAQSARSRLINYIDKGHVSIGRTVEERISITKEYQEEWHGATVKRKGTNNKGAVSHLIAQSASEITAEVMNRLKNVERSGKQHDETPVIFPFKAYVRWEDGSYGAVDLNYLEKLTHQV